MALTKKQQVELLYAVLTGKKCPYCKCDAMKYCDGCDEVLCAGCYDCHNGDCSCAERIELSPCCNAPLKEDETGILFCSCGLGYDEDSGEFDISDDALANCHMENCDAD